MLQTIDLGQVIDHDVGVTGVPREKILMIVLRGVEPFECCDLGRNGLRENARPVELVDVPPAIRP